LAIVIIIGRNIRNITSIACTANTITAHTLLPSELEQVRMAHFGGGNANGGCSQIA
jgi:hypothetical protein